MKPITVNHTIKKLSIFVSLAFLVAFFVAIYNLGGEASDYAVLKEKLDLLADHSIIFDGELVQDSTPLTRRVRVQD